MSPKLLRQTLLNFPRSARYGLNMSRKNFPLLICGLLVLNFSAEAAGGKIIKVLPQFFDAKGRRALSPSLYERDAYQAFLRANPGKCSGLAYNIEWKSKDAAAPRLRVELRGTPQGDRPKELMLEKSVARGGGFGKWTAVTLEGKDFAEFGKVTAWRATLWDGNELLAEQKSFLWQ